GRRVPSPLDFLSRSPNPISHAPPLGVFVDLLFDCRALVHLDGMAFPRALSLPDDFRMAGTFARAVRRDARFQRRFGVSISAYAFGVVVPVVDCAFAGNDFRLAARDSTTRDRICRCAATLLDGCRVPTAALSRPTAGLLFAGHV